MEKTEIQKLIQVEAEKIFEKKMRSVQYGNFATPRHVHNGKDAPKISQSDIVPNRSAVGSITMSTSQRYTLGLTFNPSQLLFFGVASNTGTGERVQIAAGAHFGTSFYFQPKSTSEVTQGGTEQNVVQGGSWLWTDNGTTTFRSRATEGHLTNVDDVGGTIVARATIPNLSTQASLAYTDGAAPVRDQYGFRSSKGYGEGFVHVDVTLGSGWAIAATFIVS